MQNLVILGATGSIGTSTLAVITKHPHTYRAYALVAHSNVEKMAALAVSHRPQYIHMVDPQAAVALGKLLDPQLNIEILSGDDALIDLVTRPEVDQVMAAIVGAAGLLPTLAAVKAGKRVLLANKESLVMSGQLFMDAARDSGAQILPVDSEHNAIFQCLPTEIQTNLGFCDLNAHGIEHILLTGSGGPFLTTDLNALSSITPEQACKHPNWSMGPKISVDSATMMNKGLEYIEARWLFNTRPEQLKVVVHPQSVIHSMVQYNDGSVIAQLGRPDMRTPIANAMAYPERVISGVEPLDFFQLNQLTFAEADIARYPCLHLAMQACQQGQGATTVLNAANEVAVAAFLNRQLSFTQIAAVNEQTLTQLAHHQVTTLDDILALDQLARQYANQFI